MKEEAIFFLNFFTSCDDVARRSSPDTSLYIGLLCLQNWKSIYSYSYYITFLFWLLNALLTWCVSIPLTLYPPSELHEKVFTDSLHTLYIMYLNHK